MLLYVVMVGTKKTLWKDDVADRETINKAHDFITSKGLLIDHREVDFHGDLIIWVKEAK